MDKAWVVMKCSQSLTTMMAHFELSGGCWYLTEATEAATMQANSADDVAQLGGGFSVGPEYSGCPSCRSDSFASCGVCREISCWNSSDRRFTCGFCRNSGLVAGSIESIRPNDWA
jgi:hypothetical protein